MKKFQLFGVIAAALFLGISEVVAQDSTIKFTNAGSGVTKYQITNSHSVGGGFQFGIQANNDVLISQLESRPILFQMGNLERMRIAASGYVGIGTAVPSVPLQVVGMTRFGGRMIIDEGDGLYFENPTQSLILRTAPGNMVINAQQGNLDFGTKEITRIRITGTNSEIRMVDASTSMGTNFGLQALSPSDSIVPFGIKAHAGQKAALMVIQNGADGRIWTVESDGSQSIKRSVLKGYGLTIGGDIMAHTYSTFADQRMELQVSSLENVMQNLRTINGISFNYKGAPFDKYLFPARRQFGLQAQQVGAVYPELITLNADSFYSINYQGFIPVLIEGMKEMDSVQTKLVAQAQAQEAQYQKLSGDFIKLSDDHTKLSNDFNKLTELVDSLKKIIEERLGVMAPGGDEFEQPVLYQNQPNPFTASTTIKYYLPYSVKTADLYIFDMAGKQLMKISVKQRGNGAEVVPGNALEAGMYIYSLIADNKEVANKRMILTK